MGTVSIVSFTEKGDRLNISLTHLTGETGWGYTVRNRFSIDKEGSLSDWTKDAFTGDLIIFIGAAGIAVRAIAPYINSKDKDPAVIVTDELGKHVIPILSGHIGGGNRYAGDIAELIGGEAVITTATDINGVWAADTWAAENGYTVADTGKIKLISGALLKGERIGFISDIHKRSEDAFFGDIPENVDPDNRERDKGILLSPFIREDFRVTLNLIPRCLCLGIGCRKGTDLRVLKKTVEDFFRDNAISFSSVSDIATIDIKRGEEAIERFALDNGLSLSFYSAEELMDLPTGFTFERSDFVYEHTGCDNVCERSAVKRALEVSPGGSVKILVKKTKGEGITMAVSIYKERKQNGTHLKPHGDRKKEL